MDVMGDSLNLTEHVGEKDRLLLLLVSLFNWDMIFIRIGRLYEDRWRRPGYGYSDSPREYDEYYQ